jgi:hypothetical protein
VRVWWGREDPTREAPGVAAHESTPEARDAPPSQRGQPRPRKRAQPTGKAGAACTGPTAQRCHQGDVWLFDGCGEPAQKLDECGAQLCQRDLCDQPDEEPCEYPEQGRCQGQLVQACVGGRAHQIDCARAGLVCRYGEEGAECAAKPSEPCTGVPRCEGEVLVTCQAGAATRIDCAALGAHCLKFEGARTPSCVEVRDDDALATECGACGCPPERGAREQSCDGRDEDGDRYIDEELDCGPVPVLALVVSDGAGSSYTQEDIESELAYVNRLFASSAVPGPISFVLKELVRVDDARLLELDDREMQELVRDARVQRIHTAREQLEVPVLFTDRLVGGGGTPKVGASTLPNGTCGGLQESVGPELGLIALAKARSPTTLAHELGHFLGLCHTHDLQVGAPRVAQQSDGEARVEACTANCSDEGDGLCDTPFDPGPERCMYDQTCSTRCADGDEPDPTNLMSYYTDCRVRFSDEQVRLMQHSLALRRGWHACEQEKCECTLDSPSCPAGMSCRPRGLGESGARCMLDGPRRPGAQCNDGLECGQGALCLRAQASGSARCVRACTTSRPGCQCMSADESLSVCVDDFDPAPQL